MRAGLTKDGISQRKFAPIEQFASEYVDKVNFPAIIEYASQKYVINVRFRNHLDVAIL